MCVYARACARMCMCIYTIMYTIRTHTKYIVLNLYIHIRYKCHKYTRNKRNKNLLNYIISIIKI